MNIVFTVCKKGKGLDGTLCNACAVGTYKDSVGNTDCTMCTSGKTTMSIGSTAASACGKLQYISEQLDILSRIICNILSKLLPSNYSIFIIINFVFSLCIRTQWGWYIM